jgi:mono/diheme cytochrome c family protein
MARSRLLWITGLGLLALAIGAPPRPLTAQSPDLIARGKYLVEVAANCAECHTPVTAEGEPDETYHLAGHVAGTPVPNNTAFKDLKGSGAVIYARNLTPDPETGLGGWTEEEFRRTLKDGIAKDGRPLRHPMPWKRFLKAFTDEDIQAVWAYLRSLPPVKNRVPDAVASPR